MSQLKVTISGSYGKHLERILRAREEFIDLGAEVLRPVSEEKVSGDSIIRMKGDPEDVAGIRQAQFQAIYESDALYIVNPGGYVGPAATLEAGFAYSLRIPIWSAEPAFEEAVTEVISAFGSPQELVRKEG